MSEVKPCEGCLPGYCRRHGVAKSLKETLACQEDDELRAKLDVDYAEREEAEEIPEGVGKELHEIFASVGWKIKKGQCECYQKSVEYSTKGLDWCEDNVDTIVSDLHKELMARSKILAAVIPMGGVKAVVQLAISRARKKEEGDEKEN